MAASEHQKWAEQQIEVLVSCGVDLQDAQRTVKRILDLLPAGQDPATWIPTAEQLWQDPSTPEAVQDARADWYASDAVPAKYKRLLDAREEQSDATN